MSPECADTWLTQTVTLGLRDYRALSSAAFLERLRDLWPDGSVELLEDDRACLVVASEGVTITAVLLPGPPPPEQLEIVGGLSDDPDADDVTSLAMVPFRFVLGCDRGAADPVAAAAFLTRCAAALCADADVADVIWGPSQLILPPGAITAAALDISPCSFPVHIWVRVVTDRAATGSWNAFTTGLAPLGLWEMELIDDARTPDVLVPLIRDIAHHLLEENCLPGDGDLLTHVGPVPVLFRHAPSVLTPSERVLRLEPGKPRDGSGTRRVRAILTGLSSPP